MRARDYISVCVVSYTDTDYTQHRKVANGSVFVKRTIWGGITDLMTTHAPTREDIAKVERLVITAIRNPAEVVRICHTIDWSSYARTSSGGQSNIPVSGVYAAFDDALAKQEADAWDSGFGLTGEFVV